ncbi:hypothetical protein ACRAJ3_01815 [Rhodococcus pyridinivorans]|uniref:hypothetical protein n=1 Tax=Rhodococcus pyridinivorans TaxID=103816 RepID=UPI003418E2FC
MRTTEASRYDADSRRGLLVMVSGGEYREFMVTRKTTESATRASLPTVRRRGKPHRGFHD